MGHRLSFKVLAAGALILAALWSGEAVKAYEVTFNYPVEDLEKTLTSPPDSYRAYQYVLLRPGHYVTDVMVESVDGSTTSVKGLRESLMIRMPTSPIESFETVKSRKYRVATIRFNMVYLDTLRQTAVSLSRVSFRVVTRPGPIPEATSQRVGRSPYVSQCINAEEFVNLYRVIERPGRNPSELYGCDSADCDMLASFVIITSEELAPAFEDHAAYKSLQGYRAKIVTVDWIRTHFPSGTDLPEKIRDFITHAYLRWGTRWVLLGGDVETIPSRQIWYQKKPMLCDNYYSGLDGDWNSDGDAFFVETPGEIDYDSETYIGRVPVKTASDVASYFEKVKQYEAGGRFDDYQQRAIFLAGYVNWSDGQARMDSVSSMVPESVNTTKLSTRRDGTLTDMTKESFLKALNDGCGLLSIYSRGNEHYFFTQQGEDQKVFREDIDALTNTGKYPIAIIESGGPGNIASDCIAERFILNPVGGTVGCYSPPVPNTDFRFVKLLVGRWYADVDETIGEAISMCTILKPGDSRRFIYLGDPTLYPWSDAPHEFVVERPAWLTKGGGQTLRVVVREGQSAVSNAMVTIDCQGKYLSRRSGADGVAEFEVDVTDNLPVILGVRKRNFWFHLDTIAVEGSRPFPVLDSLVLSDDPQRGAEGDGDGKFEPGETIRCALVVRNSGAEPLGDLTCIAHTRNPSIELVDSKVKVPRLAPHETVQTPMAFTFEIGQGGIDADSLVGIEVSIRFEDTTVEYSKPIPVVRPKASFAYSTVEVDNFEARCGEIYYGDGETIRLGVAVANDGNGSLDGVWGRLVPVDSGRVSLDGGADSVFYGTIDPLSMPEPPGPFVFTYHGEYAPLDFILELRDSSGTRYPLDFRMSRNVSLFDSANFRCKSSTVSISWDCVATVRWQTYNVYRSTDSENFVRVNSRPVGLKQYVDESVADGEKYYYRFTCLNLDGTESIPSSIYSTIASPVTAPGWPVEQEVSTLTPLISGPSGSGPPTVYIGQAGYGIYTVSTSGEVSPFWVDASSSSLEFGYMALTAEDIDQDGQLDILSQAKGTPNKLCARESGGDSEGWPVAFPGTEALYCSAVSVADLDHDGYYEVFAITRKGSILAATHDGKPLFGEDFVFEPIHCDWNMSAVAIGDVDGDAELDLVVSGSNDSVYAFDRFGKRLTGFPVHVFGRPPRKGFPGLGPRGVDRPSTPILADFDGDRKGLEICVSSGFEYVFVIDADSEGARLALKWPPEPFGDEVAFYTQVPPSVVDVDGDGRLEIAVLHRNQLAVVGFEGEMRSGWPVRLDGISTLSRDNMLIVGDIDNDREPEILVNFNDDFLRAYNGDGSLVPGYPISLDKVAGNVPSLADLKGDGQLWIIKGDEQLVAWETGHPYRPEDMLWPTAQHDNHRTCSLMGTKPILRHIDSISVVETGTSTTISADVFEPDARWGDSLTFRWRVSEGLIVGSGPEATYLAPSGAADVVLTLLVYDCGGNTIKASYRFKVVSR